MKIRRLPLPGPMVNEVLAGRKCETRRLSFDGEPGDEVWFKETYFLELLYCEDYYPGELVFGEFVESSHGLRKAGPWMIDALQGKMPMFITFKEDVFDLKKHVKYLATDGEQEPENWKKCPSVFMPDWAVRLKRKILAVRQEPLLDITEEGAEKEGFEANDIASARQRFLAYWDHLNEKKYPATSNPKVWVITFEQRVGL